MTLEIGHPSSRAISPKNSNCGIPLQPHKEVKCVAAIERFFLEEYSNILQIEEKGATFFFYWWFYPFLF
jgi:hypothetical protein